MDKQGPKISVIVAVYNGAATLERCLDSFAAQIYPHKELIVLDGGSTDGTQEILRGASPFISCWESERDRGIYHAWNKGLARATGDWICFLGADDYFWNGDALAWMAPFLASRTTQSRVVYGQIAVTDGKGRVLKHRGEPWEQAKKEFNQYLSLPHPGLFHHRSLFAEHGNFDESFEIVGDYDLLLRELPHRTARFIPNIITVGVEHGGVSNSPRAMPRLLAELARVRAKYGIRRTPLLRASKTQWKMTLAALAVRLIGDGGFRWVADARRRVSGQPTFWRDARTTL